MPVLFSLAFVAALSFIVGPAHLAAAGVYFRAG